MEVISVNGLADLSNFLSQASDHLVMLYFYVEESPECTQMTDVITELVKSKEDSRATIIKIDSSKADDICKKYSITSVPAFNFIMDGKVVDGLIGANVPIFSKKFEENMKLSKQNMDDRLRKLINKAPVMLFMKGNPNTPRCGFSKQVIALLNSHNAKYETFDILEDYEVREGLKKFSNWPTYPQLYVKGELIGGLDILKELSESGELDSILAV